MKYRIKFIISVQVIYARHGNFRNHKLRPTKRHAIHTCSHAQSINPCYDLTEVCVPAEQNRRVISSAKATELNCNYIRLYVQNVKLNCTPQLVFDKKTS